MFSPIPMGIPNRFVRGILDGTLARYGCILKEGASGRIVGHLKELAGPLSGPLPNLILSGASALARVGQWLNTNAQLNQIQTLLHRLQLVSSIGAVASVAGLGVSVAGFAVVVRRLDRLEQNLNKAMDHIRAQVERLHPRMEMLDMARLHAAWERLDGAGRTDHPERQTEMLRDADRCFQEYRNFYFILLMELRPASRPELSLPQVGELYGRYFACAAAELEGNFLLRDFAQWRFRHEAIDRQMADVCSPDFNEMFRSRVYAGGQLTKAEREGLGEQARAVCDVCKETRERLLTADQEIGWLERTGVAPADYLRQLQACPDAGLVVVPHEDPGT